MDTSTKTTAKDFFLWLGAMAALYVSAISLITLLFQYIERLFPDELSSYVDPYSGAIRFAIASLIVLFPLFVYLMRRINEDLRENPEKKDIWIRRWLTYITLFLAGGTLVIDLITLINYFLGGDLTTRFVLKVAVVFIVIGAAFLYFLYSLRGYWDKHEGQSKLAGTVAALVVVASIVGGFFIIGSPQMQRDLRLDQERVQDLQSIQSQIVNYWQQKGSLPEALEGLEDPILGFKVPVDPVTEDAYVYERTGTRSFELCATFALESPNRGTIPSLARPYGGLEQNWEHGAGETCYERTIDPELFPVRE